MDSDGPCPCQKSGGRRDALFLSETPGASCPAQVPDLLELLALLVMPGVTEELWFRCVLLPLPEESAGCWGGGALGCFRRYSGWPVVDGL